MNEEWMLIDDTDGSPVQLPTKRKDFRGTPATITGFVPPTHPGSTGKIITDEGSYFPSVYSLRIVRKEIA